MQQMYIACEECHFIFGRYIGHDKADIIAVSARCPKCGQACGVDSRKTSRKRMKDGQEAIE